MKIKDFIYLFNSGYQKLYHQVIFYKLERPVWSNESGDTEIKKDDFNIYNNI